MYRSARYYLPIGTSTRARPGPRDHPAPGDPDFTGRTVPVWRMDPVRSPWLLRPFDRLHFTPVSVAELERIRADVTAGRRDLEAVPGVFRLADLDGYPAATAFTNRRRPAFAAERARWAACLAAEDAPA